MIQKNR